MPTSYVHISVHPSPTFFFVKYNICAACLSLHVTQKPFLRILKKCWRNNSCPLILLYIIRVINDQTFFATWQHNKSWIPITLLYEMIMNRYILGNVSSHSVCYHYNVKIDNNLVNRNGGNGLKNANDLKVLFCLMYKKELSRGLHEHLGCLNYLLKCFC